MSVKRRVGTTPHNHVLCFNLIMTMLKKKLFVTVITCFFSVVPEKKKKVFSNGKRRSEKGCSK